jgi:Mlc titration factor MtfA (ptsG expression regulator)
MPFVFLFFFCALVALAVKRARREEAEADAEEAQGNNYVPDDNRIKFLTYYGGELKFFDDELQKVLDKHFPYYTRLDDTGKEKFLHRLKKFISEKIFVIHDESGFKEMPILISASAIQISFGLDKYLLPYFSHIHIFPEEFIGYHPTLRLLEGNVSGHSVNLSWKHFLNGYKFPQNGQNVGLHEFAHAFYYQYFEVGENIEKDFVARFPLFDACGNKAFQQEQQPGNNLYSDYALTNFQEFWAESVEVFFEKPVILKAMYPDLFEAMKEILKQDTVQINNT